MIEYKINDKAILKVIEHAALYDLVEKRKREERHLEEEELSNLFGQIVLAMYSTICTKIRFFCNLKSENWIDFFLL